MKSILNVSVDVKYLTKIEKFANKRFQGNKSNAANFIFREYFKANPVGSDSLNNLVECPDCKTENAKQVWDKFGGCPTCAKEDIIKKKNEKEAIKKMNKRETLEAKLEELEAKRERRSDKVEEMEGFLEEDKATEEEVQKHKDNLNNIELNIQEVKDKLEDLEAEEKAEEILNETNGGE